MTKNKTNPQPATIPADGKTLRQQAEDALKKRHLDRGPVAPEDAKRLQHELEVHQIELEMQNEELRRAHVELDAARARYFDLYDLAPVGYCTVSEQGLLLEANLTAATLLGVARGQLAGQQTFARLIHSDDQDIYYLHCKQLFETGEPQACELRMVKKDGAAFWAHMKATVAQDENGASVARIVLNDITLRKQEEEALRQSEEKYRTLFTGMSQGAFYQAADGRLLDVNPAALRIFGLTRQEFLERTSHSPAWKVIREDGSEVPPEEHPSMVALKIGIQIKDLTLGIFNQITNSYVWVIVNATPQYLPGENSPFQVYLTLHDITQRKQAEEALKNSEYRQKALLNNIPDIAWIKDIEGKYIAVNESYEKAAVCLQEEIIGKNDEDLWPAGCAAQYRKNDIQVMQSGKRIAVEENMIDHDGAAKVMEAIRTPLYDNKGDLIGTVGIARDVTERVKTAEMLRMASQKWRDTFDAMSDSVALLSVDGRIEQCNRALIDYLGLDFPAVLYQKCHQLIHQTEDYLPGCPIVKSLASGLRETMELQIGEKFFLVVADPIKAPDGKIIGFVHIMRDITERRLVEAALHETEDLLAEVRQIAHLGTWTNNPETGEFLWSDEVYRIFGLPADRSISQADLMQYVHPEDYPGLVQTWIDMRDENSLVDIEYRIVRPDGDIRYVHDYSIYKSGDNGPIMSAAGILHDITERKQAEAALTESEAQKNAILNGITTNIALVDKDQKILWANKAAAHSANKQAEDMVGHHCYSFWGDPAKPCENCPAFKTFQTGQSEQKVVQTPDGRIWDERGEPVFDAAGNVIAVVEIAQDITLRMQAEEALKELNLAVEQSRDGIAFADMDGYVRFSNTAWARMHGYRVEELIGRHLSIFHTPEQLETDVIPFNQYALANGSQEGEVGHVRKDGTTFPTWMSSTVVKDQGQKATGWLGIARDITDIKLAEEALRTKNIEMERFTYSVSHDLRSPLVTIRTFMGHLMQDMANDDKEHVAQDLDYINGASQKMVELLDELLQLSRIGRMVNISVEAPLQDIVREALVLVAGRIDERGALVTITEKPVLLYGDRVRLVEVFQNLVDNAVKFMGEQKEPLVEIGAEKKNGDIVCFVRDNGMGIDPRFRDKLFGLFEKLNSGMEGSGIGLALVKRIIEVHGGKIRAESAGIGKGACFWFSLPGK